MAAETQGGIQRRQQQDKAPATETPRPAQQRRRVGLRRIAIDAEGRKWYPLSPPAQGYRLGPRPETPLIDLGDEEPAAATEPSAAPRPSAVSELAAAFETATPSGSTNVPRRTHAEMLAALGLDRQEEWEDIGEEGGDWEHIKKEGEEAGQQIFVTFDPLLMCPCNLEGHACMLPLRCQYGSGMICTKWVSLPCPSPVSPYSCMLL